MLRSISESWRRRSCRWARPADWAPGRRLRPYGPADADFTAGLVDVLADRDDALLAAFVNDGAVSYGRLRGALAQQTGRALVHPVFFGSAITGAGVDVLIAGITDCCRRPKALQTSRFRARFSRSSAAPAGEKIAYVRLFSGTVRVAATELHLRHADGRTGGKVTAISVFDHGAAVRATSVAAGQIGMLWGLGRHPDR